MLKFNILLISTVIIVPALAGNLELDDNPFGFFHDPDLNRYFYNGRDQLRINETKLKQKFVKLQVSLDDAPYVDSTSQPRIKNEGRHTLRYRVLDPMNQIVFSKQIQFYLDRTPPTTRILEKGYVRKSAGVYFFANANAIQLSAFDSLAGVEGIEFSHDGKTFEAYKNTEDDDDSPKILKQGKNKLYYRSSDRVGNVEKVRTLSYVLSSKAPTTELSVSPEPVNKDGEYYIGVNHVISLKAKAAEIPVKKIMVNLDGREFEYSKPFRVPLPGAHKLSYYAIDEADNKEEPHVHEFRTDDSAPITNLEYNGTILDFTEMALVGADFSISLSASDESGADVDQINYSIWNSREPASLSTYKAPIEIQGDGKRTISIRSIDKVGNREGEKIVTVIPDRTPPTTRYKPVIPFRTFNKKTYSSYPNLIVLEASDNIAGVKSVLYSLNGGEFEEYVSPIKLPRNELNEIRFKSVDSLGNEEPVQALSIHMIGPGIQVEVNDRNGKLSSAARAVASE